MLKQWSSTTWITTAAPLIYMHIVAYFCMGWNPLSPNEIDGEMVHLNYRIYKKL